MATTVPGWMLARALLMLVRVSYRVLPKALTSAKDRSSRMEHTSQRHFESEERMFLTTDEVKARLRVTPRTIYRLIRSGELPAVRVGRQWRFRRSDLDRWLECRQQGFSG
jgi:excisionase family DNA binding protein